MVFDSLYFILLLQMKFPQMTYADKVDLAEKCIHILGYDWFNFLLVFHSTEGALECTIKSITTKAQTSDLPFFVKFWITEVEYFSILHKMLF